MARRQPRPPSLYALADADALAPTPLPDAFAAMAGAGVRWIQVRAKRLADDRLYRALEACCRLAETLQVKIWIDDRVDLAAMLPVDGVHLGQADLPPAIARRILGDDVWIGWSTHNREQLAAAESDPAVDLIALGPIYPTTGKRDPDPVVGLEELGWAAARVSKPLVAIGGIDSCNISQVLRAGADGAAVLGAVCRPPIAASARALLEAAEAIP